MYDLNQLEKNVITWRKNRGLDQSTSKDAFMKTAEEFGEIAQALNKQNDELLMDAIGDTLVCLVGLAASKNMTLGECLHYAYEEIKDRTGGEVRGTRIDVEEKPEGVCVACGKVATEIVYIARSY